MPRNIEGKYQYDIVAIVTQNKDRILGGRQLTLLAQNEEEQKAMAEEVALTMKASVVKVKFGDYFVIRML